MLPLLCAWLVPTVDGAAPATRLAFERDISIWLSAIDGSAPMRIARGQSPELSPDGTRLAYNTVQPTGQPAHRQLAVFNLATKTTTILEKVPSTNAMVPRWSPDGTRLLFDYYANDERRIGVINADGSGFAPVPDTTPAHRNYWSAAWAADGRTFFAQDMEQLYRLDLQGKIVKEWRIEHIVPRGGMSGDIRLAAAPDGRTLLMDVEMDERARPGWDGPPPAVWLFDLGAETSRRLTPPTLYAWDCAWLDAPDTILFLSQARGETTPSIYRMTTSGNGADRRLVVRNARGASASP